MKNRLFAVLLLAAGLAACSRETVPDEEFTLRADMPFVRTRTSLGAKADGVYPVVWSEGDRITVNGVESRPLSASEAGSSTAVFRFSDSIAAPYNVSYGDGVPSFQTYSEGNICSGSAPMAAVSSQVSFVMGHQSAVLRLPLSGSVTVTGISAEALDGTALSEGKTVHLVTPGGGVDVSTSKVFCIAVRPGTYAKGVKLEVFASGGERMSLVSFIGETLDAGTVYEFPATAFSPDEEAVIAIDSYSALKAFAARVGAGEKYLEARLMADIAADGTWAPLEGFTGDFDGGGHTISGLHKAFANELCGCVRNLTLEADISISSKDDIAGDASVYWAGILCNRMFTGALVRNCVTAGSISYSQWGKTLRVGAVCGYAARGTMENCVNRASVIVTGDGSAVVEAGGILGRAYASADEVNITGCRNSGTLSLSGTLKSPETGGIAGRMDAAGTSALRGNTFAGEIVFESGCTVSGNLDMGGIAGYVKIASVSDCVSAGTMSARASSASEVRCGGILGYANKDDTVTSLTLSDCTFGGDITVDIASHSTIYARPFTARYAVTGYVENNCVNTGTITEK